VVDNVAGSRGIRGVDEDVPRSRSAGMPRTIVAPTSTGMVSGSRTSSGPMSRLTSSGRGLARDRDVLLRSKAVVMENRIFLLWKVMFVIEMELSSLVK